MNQYVILVRLRENHQVSSTRSPSQIVNEAVTKASGKLISSHATLGFYDLCIVAQFPDAPSAFRASTSLKGTGWITETMQAQALSDFDSIYSEASREASSTSSRR